MKLKEINKQVFTYLLIKANSTWWVEVKFCIINRKKLNPKQIF